MKFVAIVREQRGVSGSVEYNGVYGCISPTGIF